MLKDRKQFTEFGVFCAKENCVENIVIIKLKYQILNIYLF